MDNVEKNLEDSHKQVGVESRGGREVKGKSNLAGEGEYLETGREIGEGKVLKVSALDQNNVKGDIKQNKEKKFSSESKTGANVFKVPSCTFLNSILFNAPSQDTNKKFHNATY